MVFIDDIVDAPVPQSWPLISIISALAIATPAAIVPKPTSATSLTLIIALGFIDLKS